MQTLINCAACTRTISKSAKACPHCGEPSKSAKMLKMALGLIAMGIGLMILIPIAVLIIGVIAGAGMQP